jgi:hypothetical protein
MSSNHSQKIADKRRFFGSLVAGTYVPSDSPQRTEAHSPAISRRTSAIAHDPSISIFSLKFFVFFFHYFVRFILFFLNFYLDNITLAQIMNKLNELSDKIDRIKRKVFEIDDRISEVLDTSQETAFIKVIIIYIY